MSYIFEWDWSKAASNARKHGVTFDEASTVFADPLGLLRLVTVVVMPASAPTGMR